MPMSEASHITSNTLEKSGSLMTDASISLFDFFERLSNSYGPLELFFLQAVHNLGHDSTESLSESPVECRQPMKTSYFSNIFGLRSLYNRLDFLKIS